MFFLLPINIPKVTPFWVEGGVEKWSPFLDSGAQSLIFRHICYCSWFHHNYYRVDVSIWRNGKLCQRLISVLSSEPAPAVLSALAGLGKVKKLKLWGENVLKGLWKGWEEETDIGVTFLFGLHSDLYCRLHSQGQALHWFLPFLFYISTLWSFYFLHFHIVKFFFSTFPHCEVFLFFISLLLCHTSVFRPKDVIYLLTGLTIDQDLSVFVFFGGWGWGSWGGIFQKIIFLN